MATTFHYQHPFPLGEDKTEYYLLTKDYVSVSEFEGTPILKVEKEGLTAMANAAFRDVSFLLRRAHNEQVAKILSDPEASENDKYAFVTETGGESQWLDALLEKNGCPVPGRE